MSDSSPRYKVGDVVDLLYQYGSGRTKTIVAIDAPPSIWKSVADKVYYYDIARKEFDFCYTLDEVAIDLRNKNYLKALAFKDELDNIISSGE